MGKKTFKNSVFMALMIVPTLVGAFFVLLLAKMSGVKDWSRD
jgi:hypothetical protein